MRISKFMAWSFVLALFLAFGQWNCAGSKSVERPPQAAEQPRTVSPPQQVTKPPIKQPEPEKQAPQPLEEVSEEVAPEEEIVEEPVAASEVLETSVPNQPLTQTGKSSGANVTLRFEGWPKNLQPAGNELTIALNDSVKFRAFAKVSAPDSLIDAIFDIRTEEAWAELQPNGASQAFDLDADVPKRLDYLLKINSPVSGSGETKLVCELKSQIDGTIFKTVELKIRVTQVTNTTPTGTSNLPDVKRKGTIDITQKPSTSGTSIPQPPKKPNNKP